MAHLQSMHLRGFKTFAKPTELVFEPGVTVIIGPNGSGKSNLADAVLWVLGEQSAGNLRGRSMQDVIFAGPGGRKSSAIAEVSLVFDNECGSFPLDTSQVEITRRLVRDGGSEYQINGAACRLLDVADLLGGLGLGKEMHSVISQGKVDALLNSTPEVRRALVEEAAGLGRFKKRRERAKAKLEHTRQNLLRVGDVEREVKAALRPLRQQVMAAERFAEATEEWALAKARLLLLSLSGVLVSCREIDDELSQVQDRRAEIEERLAGLRRNRIAEEEQFSQALRQREELGGIYQKARSDSEWLESRAVALRQRVARNEGDLDRACRRKELALGELASLTSRVKEVAAATADQARLQTVSGYGQILRAALEESLPAYRQASAAEDDLKDRVFELEAARSRALQDRDFLRREAQERGRTGSQLAALVKEAMSRVEALQTETAALERQKIAAQADLHRVQERLAMAASERGNARVRAEETSLEEVTLSEMLTGVESRRAVLQDTLERRQGVPAGAKELLRNLNGCRLLTEVLDVEPGCERALAAVLGPLAQAVILTGRLDIELALGATGPLEALWPSSCAEMAEVAGPPATSKDLKGLQEDRGSLDWVEKTALPPGTRDLWEVLSGPESIVATLKSLLPPAKVLPENVSLAEVVGSPLCPCCLVTRSGELIQGGVHAARRWEAGAEALLKAGNELRSVVAEHSTLLRKQEEVRRAAQEAAAAAACTEEACREQEARLREAEGKLALQENECDLRARRLEEAKLQHAELLGRQGREFDLADQILADLKGVEEAIAAREMELDEARASLRSVQADLESMRKIVGRLEDKKSQAALLEVKLRERCRAQEGERERAAAQHRSAELEARRSERRVAFLERYMPVLTSLLAIVEQLAERSRAVVADLGPRVEEARAHSENAAKIIRDWGGAELDLQRELEALLAKASQLQVSGTRLEDRRSLLEEELAELRRRHLSPRSVTPADIAGEDADALLAAVERSERRREKIGLVNPLADQECAEMEERAHFLAEQRRDLEASLAQLQEVISELDEHIERVFTEIFEATKENFSAVIATVFPGAKGDLRLTEGRAATVVNPEDEGSLSPEMDDEEPRRDASGIALDVRLPNKAPRSMSLLSGGEKAMTAIAFLFSLFLARPCPFYILDEVEASLDDLNIRRFLSLIKKYRGKTQFIVITHQRQTMEVADTLYGVALESDGTSRVLSRRLGEKKETRSKSSLPETADLIQKGA